MLEDLGKDLANIAMAGVGAIAILTEKAVEVGKVCAEKGAETLEKGKAASEELRRKGEQVAAERREKARQDYLESLDGRRPRGAAPQAGRAGRQGGPPRRQLPRQLPLRLPLLKPPSAPWRTMSLTSAVSTRTTARASKPRRTQSHIQQKGPVTLGNGPLGIFHQEKAIL